MDEVEKKQFLKTWKVLEICQELISNIKNYCKTYNVGRMWNLNPEMTRNSRKESLQISQNCDPVSQKCDLVPEKISSHLFETQVLFSRKQFTLVGNQVTFSGNEVTFLGNRVTY